MVIEPAATIERRAHSSLNHCCNAYRALLSLPYEHEVRTYGQETMARLRDCIAAASGVSPQQIQTAFEEACNPIRR